MIFEILLSTIVFFIGASIGSFLNVVIERFARGNQPITGRSACPHCQRTLRWFELLPVVSYVIQVGKCRSCGYKIPLQYLTMELVCAAIAFGMLFQLLYGYVSAPQALLTTGALYLLIVLFMIDLKTFYLPDIYIVLLTILALIWAALEQPISGQSMLLGAVTGSGFLFLLWLVTKGKGLGFGDVKLMIPLGLLFGLPGTIFILFSSFVVGGMVGIVLLALGKANPKTAIPFGPYLTGAAVLLLLWPDVQEFFFHILLSDSLPIL